MTGFPSRLKVSSPRREAGEGAVNPDPDGKEGAGAEDEVVAVAFL